MNPQEIERRLKIVEDRLAWQHQTTIKGLLEIYPKDKVLKGSVYPLLATLFIIIGLKLAEQQSYDIVKDVADTSVSVLPNILGFLLGGYTILIGFGNINLLKSTTRLVNGRQISLFQMLSSIFALTIFVQAFTLAIALFFHFTLKIPISENGNLSFLFSLVPFLNWAGSTILLFLLFYSVFALRDMVMNVFGFAQNYHLALVEERMADEAAARHPK